MPSTPKNKRIKIKQYGVEIARLRYTLDSIPSLKDLENKFSIGRIALTKYLKEGIRVACGEDKTDDVYREIWTSKIIPKYQEIIRQRGEQLTQQFTDPKSEWINDASKIPSLKELKQEFRQKGINTSTPTTQVYIEEGIARVVGSQNRLETSRKMGFHFELPLEYQKIVQQIAINLTKQFVDPSSLLFYNQKAIPTQLKILEDLTTRKINIGLGRTVRYLKTGVEKVVGINNTQAIFKQMWPRAEIAKEIQEMVQNKGKEIYSKFTDPRSNTYQNSSKLESIKQIRNEFIAKGFIISEGGVLNHVKQGVILQAGENYSEKLWKQMFPHTVPSDVEEKMKEIGEKWAQKFTEFTSIIQNIQKVEPQFWDFEHFSEFLKFLKSVPTLETIQDNLKKNQFDTSLTALRKYLKKGIGRVESEFSAKEIYTQLFPHGTPPIIQEMVQTEGAMYTALFCDPSSRYFQDSSHIPTIMGLRKKYQEIGFDLSEGTISKNLKHGVERIVGLNVAQEYYKRMWARLDTPIDVQKKVMQIGVKCTEQLLASKVQDITKRPVFNSIKNIQKDLKNEGIGLSDKTIAKYLKLGVESRVGIKLGCILYSEIWPETVPEKLQEYVKEIFINDVKNLVAGKLAQIKSLNQLEDQLRLSKKSIIKYGKIELTKAFGVVRGGEIYEKRIAVFQQDELLGKSTHVIINDVLKESLEVQGIKYFREVKLPVPDPLLAQDYVQVDGIAIFKSGQFEQILNEKGTSGKSLSEELQLPLEIVKIAKEIAFEATANVTNKNLQEKCGKYAIDKDRKPVEGRIVLVVSNERGPRNLRVVHLSELPPNARLITPDFAADLVGMSENGRSIIAEALRNSDAHNLTAQEALIKREEFQYASDSNAYWLTKTGHVPDLRYWQDLTDYFSPNCKVKSDIG